MKNIIASILILVSTAVFAEDGFLPNNDLPNSLKILPAPPNMEPIESGSGIFYPAFSEDQNISKEIFIRKTFFNGREVSQARLNQAVSDANTSVENFVNIFLDPLSIKNKEAIKQILVGSDLITKIRYDGKNSTVLAKEEYLRERPYFFYNTAICAGDPDPHHSYPSGHSTRGMLVAYVIADLLPENYRSEILARGMAYGDSRVICGAHWRSDVQAGRVMANAVYNKLTDNEAFNNEFNNVKRQIRALS